MNGKAMMLTLDERRLIAAYRAADERARADALYVCQSHPAKRQIVADEHENIVPLQRIYGQGHE